MNTKPRRLALLIAVDEYRDQQLGDLKSPVADAKKLKAALEHERCGFSATLLDNRPRREIETAIADLYEHANPHDLVLFFFSGHGVRDANGKLYLALPDTVKARPRIDSLDAEYVKEQIADTFSKKTVTILDCCFAASFASEGCKGGDCIFRDDMHVEGEGHYTLAATADRQLAYETHGQSIYAKYLLEALTFAGEAAHETAMTVSRLQAYLRDKVRTESPSMKPEWWAAKPVGDLVLAANRTAAPVIPRTDRLERPAIEASVPQPEPAASKNAASAKARQFPRPRRMTLAIAVSALVTVGASVSLLALWNGSEPAPVPTLTSLSALPMGTTYRILGFEGICETAEVCVGAHAGTDWEKGDFKIKLPAMLPLLCARSGTYGLRMEIALTEPLSTVEYGTRRSMRRICAEIGQGFAPIPREMVENKVDVAAAMFEAKNLPPYAETQRERFERAFAKGDAPQVWVSTVEPDQKTVMVSE